MNTIHEMLLPDLIDARIADRRADAVAARRAREAAAASRTDGAWSLAGALRLPGWGTGRTGRAAKAV